MSENFKPQTTTEAILGKIAGIYNGEMPKAYTRLHLLLQKIAEEKTLEPDDISALTALVEDALRRIDELESHPAGVEIATGEDINAIF